jgi:hypothetical protein
MGFRPSFRLDCGRRSGSLIRALAPHQAKPGLFSGGVSSIKGTSYWRVSPTEIPEQVSRDIPAPGNPVSTGSIAINHRVLGALESSCGNRSLFTRYQNFAPEKPQGQHETVIETFCEIGQIT